MQKRSKQELLKDIQQLKQKYNTLESLHDNKKAENKGLSEKLNALEWMLKPKRTASMDFAPEYGDLSSLNEDGLISKSIPKHQLQDIVSEYLDLLETSAAIYERNGDYALGIFSSGWCRMMDTASRRLCNTNDNRKALESGKWLCHDSCWKDASLKSMTEGKPVEVECNGGINLYAVPVWANKQIIGAINFGFGSPPKDDAELKKLSKKYKLPLSELRKQSNNYTDRPRFVIDYAKQRIQKAAQYLGYIIERKIAGDKLLESEENYMTTFHSIGDAVITTDKEGKITNMNPTAEEYCGWLFKDAEGKPLSEVFRIVNAKTMKTVADPVKKVLKSEKVIGLANHTVLISKSGQEYQIADTAAPIKNRDGEITGVVLVFSDVTREYSMREKLRQSEERFNFAMMVKNEGIWDWDLITNTTFFDDRYYTMAGYAPNEFPQTFEAWAERVHPEDLETAQAFIKAYLEGVFEKYDIEFRFRRKDGQWMWIQGQGKVIERDAKGKPTRMIGTHTDITERKSAEERLQKSMRQLKSFLHISQSITSTLDQDKLMQKIVDDAINVMGLDSGVIYIRNDEKTIKLVSTTPALPADFPETYRIAPIKEHLRVESVFKTGDYVIMPDSITAKLTPAERDIIEIRKLRSNLYLPIKLREEVIGVLILGSINRKYEFVKEDISLLQGFANHAAQVINNIQNFNELKKYADKLLESEENYMTTFHSIGDAVITTDKEGKITNMNPTAEEYCGWLLKDAEGKPLSEVFRIVNAKTMKTVADPVKKVLKSEKVIGLANHTVLISKSGQEYQIADTAAPIKNREGEITGVVLVFSDVTEKYNAEKQLEQTKEHYRIISETTTDFTFSSIKEKRGYEIDWIDGAVNNITGYSIDDIKAKRCWRFMVHPDDDAIFVKQVLTLKPGEESECELRIHDQIGALKWLSVKTICLVNKDKEKLKIYGGCEDITERKRAEESLLRTQYTVDKSPLSIFWISPQGKFIYVNETVAKKLQYSRRDLLSMHVWDIDPNYPREKRKEMFNLYRKTGEISFESEHKRSDGKMLPVRINSYYLAFEDQEMEIAEAEDITERKQVEEALRKSEEQHSRLFKTMSQGVIYKAVDDTIVLANPAAEKMLGLSLDQIRGKTSMDPRWKMITEDGKKVSGNEHPSTIALKTGKKIGPVTRGVYIPEKDEYVWLSITATPLFKPGETKPFQSYAVFDDITLKKQHEDEIKKQQQLIHTILNKLPIGIAINTIDSELKVELVNENFAQIYGVKSEDLHTVESFWETVYEDEAFREKIKNRVLSDINSGDPKRMQWHDIPITKNGKVIKYVTAQNILLKEHGLIVSTVIDTTERKKAEIEIINAKNKAQESDRLKSAFLANMSHEIRTPMNGIMGFAELLKDPKLSIEQQKNYIDIIEESGTRMLNLINNIVDISRIEAGEMDVYPTKSNINEQLDFIFSFFKPQVEAKGLQFVLSKTLPEEQTIIVTDRHKLFAILSNLVKNAIKYSNKGIIEYGCIKKDPYLEFFVIDTGIGIPKTRHKAIFQRFVQADIEDKSAREGAGLGLAISKAYVEMLGGKIWVESEEGKGSTFYFTIPFKTKIQKSANITTTASIEKNEIQQKKLKILIVEDDEISAMLISKFMQSIGKVLLQANSGQESVEICKQHPDIDLILMDVKMPGMDGEEATRQIRSFNKDVVIIAQSAKAFADDRQKMLDAGCNEYLTKPIKQKDLNKIIKKTML